MKVRNKPFKELNTTEQRIVRQHYQNCNSDKTLNCFKEHKNVVDFWEAHREIDTNNGEYNGWNIKKERIK